MSTGGSYLGEAYPGGDPAADPSIVANSDGSGGGLGAAYPGEAYPGGVPTTVRTAGDNPVGGPGFGGSYLGQVYPGGAPGSSGAAPTPDASATRAIGVAITASGTVSGVGTNPSSSASTSVTAATSAGGQVGGTASDTTTVAITASGTRGASSSTTTAVTASVTAGGTVRRLDQATLSPSVGTAASGTVGRTAQTAVPTGVGTSASGSTAGQSATDTGVTITADGQVSIPTADLPVQATITADGHVTQSSTLAVALAEASGATGGTTVEGLTVTHLLATDAGTISVAGANHLTTAANDRGYAVSPLIDDINATEQRSFERWLRFRFPSGTTSVRELAVTASLPDGLSRGWQLHWGSSSEYQAPTDAASSVAVLPVNDQATLNLDPDTLALAWANTYSGWLVLQATAAGAEHGPMTGYQYDYYSGKTFTVGVELAFTWVETVAGEDRPGRFVLYVNAGLAVPVTPTAFVTVQSVAVASRRRSGQVDSTLTGRPVAQPVQQHRIHYTSV